MNVVGPQLRVVILLYSVVSHTSHFNSPLLFPVSYEERQRELCISESFHFRKKYSFPGKGERKKRCLLVIELVREYFLQLTA